jgi:hypothetical protein
MTVLAEIALGSAVDGYQEAFGGGFFSDAMAGANGARILAAIRPAELAPDRHCIWIGARRRR